jgi:hypothetical protein
MKTLLVLFRYRLLLVNVLALALALGALAASPTPALADPAWACESGCWDWNARDGCTQSVTCCSNERGQWFCTGS